MTVITRVAPSPTGYMHIGTARTALFNYLYAKHTGGQFLLRIEDTDRERSTQEAVDALLDGLKWLGLDWDGTETYQFARSDRHAEIARQLVESGAAYYCYLSPEETDAVRAECRDNGTALKSPWRDREPSTAPQDIKPVIRIKSPLSGETVIQDKVQGTVTVQNTQLDDMVLLRSDGTPTYMLAVVVDDHDMGITHVIRGDDHLTNTFRQNLIYQATGWDIPEYAHIPLIHGEDGKKLSKRHGAVGVSEFREMGYLPEALRNYLTRLGWSHGDDEIFSDEQAIEWFNLESIVKSPARLDFKKLDNVNAHYMQQCNNERLLNLIKPKIEENIASSLNDREISIINSALPALKERAKTLVELTDSTLFFVRPIARENMDERAQNALSREEAPDVLTRTVAKLESVSGEFSPENAHSIIEAIMEETGLKMGKIGPVIRAAVCGTMNSPDLSLVLSILGAQESANRIKAVL